MTPEQYQAAVFRAVDNELTELQLQYDTRVLATAMLHRSVHLLRCLMAAGKWQAHDVQVVVTEALADLHVPLDTKPREMFRGPNDLPT
jgi:hypothetical protein